MLKIFVSSLLLSTTATVSMVEWYQWNQMTMRGAAGSTATAVADVSVISRPGEDHLVRPVVQKDHILYLKLEMDALGQVRVLEESTIPGVWHARQDAQGAKLYFEVISLDNEVLLSGERADPLSGLSGQKLRHGVPFVLSLPYFREASKVNIFRKNLLPDSGQGGAVAYHPLLSHSFQNSL